MERVLSRGLLVASLVAAVTACKAGNPPGSVTKFDSNHTSTLDFRRFESSRIRDICSRSPIFFFVGNAEHPLVTKANRTESFAGSGLSGIINTAKKQLRQSLLSKPYECEFSDRNDSRALAVFITDGPYSNDSEIEAIWFKTDISVAQKVDKGKIRSSAKLGYQYSAAWVEDRKSSGSWVYKDGKLSKQGKNSTRFELHLPTDLEGIVKFFMDQKPEDKPSHVFDQTIYMFKSHGSKFYYDGNDIDLAQFYRSVNGTLDQKKMYHSFLFDRTAANGADATSGLIVPTMKAAGGCKEFAGKLKDDAGAPTKELCAVCLPHLGAGEKGIFAKCESITVAKKDEKGDTLSPTAHDTLSPTAHDTLSPTAHDTLSPTAHDTLSPTAHDTLSPTAHDTLSPTAHDTLSPTAHDTLGSSKTTVFAGQPGKDLPDPLMIASGVSYTELPFDVRGLKRMSLPLKGGKKNPPLVVLDSCWGDAALVDGSFDLVDSKTPVVIALNPNPMGVAAINYGALDYIQYLMYPSLQTATLETSLWRDYKDMKLALDSYMEENGLTQDTGVALTDAVEKSTKTLRVFVIRDNKLIE